MICKYFTYLYLSHVFYNNHTNKYALTGKTDTERRRSYKPHIYLKRMYRVLFASINSETRQERRTEQEYHTGQMMT